MYARWQIRITILLTHYGLSNAVHDVGTSLFWLSPYFACSCTAPVSDVTAAQRSTVWLWVRHWLTVGRASLPHELNDSGRWPRINVGIAVCHRELWPCGFARLKRTGKFDCHVTDAAKYTVVLNRKRLASDSSTNIAKRLINNARQREYRL